jgi:hypothetical protein
MRNSDCAYALSLKQPWATLLVYGHKTIEVRRWPTARRGYTLIHAARIPDERAEAWKHVPEELQDVARLSGGIVGAAELTGCIAYRDREVFVKDQTQHLNEPDWFKGPVLYGFKFARANVLPFRSYPGWMRFFPVQEDSPTTRKRSPR